MAIEILMPKLGLTMEEGTIEQWMKREGEAVAVGDILFSVATDKLTNDIEAEDAGVLLKILAQPGDTVPCKSVIGYLGVAGEAMPGEAAAVATAAPVVEATPVSTAAAADDKPCCKGACSAVASPYAKKLAKEKSIDVKSVPATGFRGAVVARDVLSYTPAAAIPAAAPVAAAAPVSGVKASPLAAKVAADAGIDLAKVPNKGRVLAADLMAYLEGSREKGAVCEAEETVPMNGMRKAIAKNMLASHMTSPTVTFNLGIDMTAMKAYREQLKANDIKVSYTDLLVKFVAKALMEFPALNCTVEDNKITYKHYVNMGVAVSIPNGLLVPNITNAEKKSLTEISAEVKELAKLAREGGLPMEKLRGGTFTITNLGMYGIESFSPIINQPEVAILGVNTMEDKVVVRNGEIVVRPIMNLSLTADHRVVDGSVAAEFLQRVKALMENPALMLA